MAASAFYQNTALHCTTMNVTRGVFYSPEICACDSGFVLGLIGAGALQIGFVFVLVFAVLREREFVQYILLLVCFHRPSLSALTAPTQYQPEPTSTKDAHTTLLPVLNSTNHCERQLSC